MSMGAEFREFIQRGNVVDMAVGVIIAFCVFLLVKGVNRLKRPEPAPAPAGPPEDVQLLTEIRDLLRRN